jgi:hypothetical protein
MNVKTNADWQKERTALLAALREFAVVLKAAPFQNEEGLRGVSAFALYWFIKQINPTVVFEVGVWRGFSTWLIEQAAPAAEVYCLDPMFLIEYYVDQTKLGQTYRSPRAHYSTQDFSCFEIAKTIDGYSRPLAFFDDHQNKWPRLLQCKAAGIKDIVFDDNTAENYTHRTLEHDRRNPESTRLLEQEIERYEIFPALWPAEMIRGPMHLKEEGIGLPVEDELRPVYEERHWHSYVTYVRLRSQGSHLV